MNLAAAAFLVIGFLALVRVLGLAARVTEVFARSRAALRDMRDPELAEEEKERRVQGHALRLLLLFVVVTAGAAVALLAPVGVVWLLERAGVVSLAGTLDVALSVPFLIGATVLICAALPLLQRRSATS